MKEEPSAESGTEVIVHDASDYDDDAFLRRLKLVTEPEEPVPFPTSAIKDWAELILVICAVVFTIFSLIMIIEWFFIWAQEI